VIRIPQYTILRCPFSNCNYVWNKRVERRTISCPLCHGRFDYPGREVEPEHAEIEFPNYGTMKKWLEEANKVSKQSKSLEEILQKTYYKRRGPR